MLLIILSINYQDIWIYGPKLSEIKNTQSTKELLVKWRLSEWHAISVHCSTVYIPGKVLTTRVSSTSFGKAPVLEF